ncbi:MAG: tRNA-dihydrouridine synthase [Pseudomonadales bacterium]|nr:tRNA-dihydrouridine synthase [Pseudomonadales bacterium]
MRIVLAPMEGLADVHLRRLLTAQGGFDWVVCEFLRVVDRVYPRRVFFTACPELENGGRTACGTPVRMQLLGSDASAMAANAWLAVELGSHGIDINFGCPSKTVNRRNGGASMLKDPESLYRVIDSVRRAVPKDVTVSAKMRLGYDDTTLMLENAHAIEAGGADELTVHARTRQQGYAPPAHWHELANIRQAISIPLIANGDIWTVADYHACVALSGTPDVMLGRGAVRCPDLAHRIRQRELAETQWQLVHKLLLDFWFDIRTVMPEKDSVGRLKQWLNHLRKVHPDAEALWQTIRTEKQSRELDRLITQYQH